MIIDKGLPEDAASWPPSVLSALAVWRQGDVVERPPLFYWADPTLPIWEATKPYAVDSLGAEVVEVDRPEVSPPYGLITTQTCDIGEQGRSQALRPWVQIAPIFKMTDSGWRRKLRRGGGPLYWLYVPGVSESDVYFVDLRIEVPIEKGWLSLQPRIEGFPDAVGRRKLADRLGRLRSRPAFSPAFDRLVVYSITSSRNATSNDGPDTGQISEVLALVDDLEDPTTVSIVALTNGPPSAESGAWLSEWKQANTEAIRAGGIDLVAAECRDELDMTVAEYRRGIVIG